MAVNIYQAVKQAMQDLVVPQIESIKGDITALRAEVRGEVSALRGEMTGLRGEMTGLDGKMDGLRGEVAANFARLDERLTIALDLRERIVALEARLTR